MWIRLAVAALDKSPTLRRMIWRVWYGRLAKKFTQSSWTFMNYGFEPEPGGAPRPLAPEHEPDRLCIELYEQVLAGVELAGKDVVEVGSGRGGGAKYLTVARRPASMLGVDFSKGAVKLCRRTHGEAANLAYAHGDAENLPLDAASRDVVLNVESSHCYGNVDRFFAEAERVLRPAGYFALADFRDEAEMRELAAKLQQLPGFELLEAVDITERVVAALVADDARKRRLIDEVISPRLQPMFGEFAGLSGGRMFRSLESRETVYWRFLLRKQSAAGGS